MGPRKSLMITATALLRTAQRVDGRSQITAHACRRLRHGGHRAQQFLLVHPARQRRHLPHRVTVRDDRADAVAAAAAEECDRRRGGDPEVTLFAAGGAEVEGLADMSTTSQVSSSRSAIICRTRMGGPRSDRPIHPSHVVAGLIKPRLPARIPTGQQLRVVAVQHAVELAAHRQLQLAQAPPSAPGHGSPRASVTAGRQRVWT